MRYGMTMGENSGFVGSRDLVHAALVGALLATGDHEKDAAETESLDLMKEADRLHRKGLAKGFRLADGSCGSVWRERGEEHADRAYLVRVGSGSTPFRTTNAVVLIAYMTALMVGDGVGVDRAAALGESVAFALSEGGGYPGNEVTELKDGRAVYAWWEGEQ